MSRAQTTSSWEDVKACRAGSRPEVRNGAVETLYTLAGYPKGLLAQLEPLLDDPMPEVRSCVAITILKGGPHPGAPNVLDEMSSAQEPSTRVIVLEALESWGDPYGWNFAVVSLNDVHPSVRRAAAQAVVSIDPKASLGLLIEALGDEDLSVRESAAEAVGRIGTPALSAVVEALKIPALESGSLLALQQLPVHGEQDRILLYSGETAARAIHYHELRNGALDSNAVEEAQYAHSVRATACAQA